MNSYTTKKKKSKISNLIDVIVGQKIQFRRQEIKISQKALARKLRISYNLLEKYEKGENKIGASRLWKISQALMIPVDYFFQDLDDELSDHLQEMVEQ